MTVYTLGEKKMPEKTWPVTVGEDTRKQIEEIQQITKDRIGYDVTQRAVVTHAINQLHKSLTVQTVQE